MNAPVGNGRVIQRYNNFADVVCGWCQTSQSVKTQRVTISLPPSPTFRFPSLFRTPQLFFSLSLRIERSPLFWQCDDLSDAYINTLPIKCYDIFIFQNLATWLITSKYLCLYDRQYYGTCVITSYSNCNLHSEDCPHPIPARSSIV